MTADLKVLTWQKVIPGHDWDCMKANPDLMDAYIRNDARQHIAAEIAERRLAQEVLSEPDPESKDPMRQTNAVLRLTVAVAARDEAALLARELAAAEDRGFRKAIEALKGNAERVSPRLGPTAHERGALDRLIQFVTAQWDHRPAAHWQPMRTCPGVGDLEYWFLTGDIGREPRMVVPIMPKAIDRSPNFEAAISPELQVFEAIAWRYAGRHPHAERAA